MAGLIKNQILKHLSKFAKNLSHDKLHLSTLKGHGELNNLELDEKVLTELLELPAWLRLTKATCNHVTLKIHWTKLKSEPIHLSLDEVVVVMETCEDLRPLSPLSSELSYNSGGKYGFSDRVIDGMTVVVNSIVINFSSPTFQASFQLSRVVLESYSPDWKKKDLRLSRIKDVDRGELLLFKRLEWQVLRIEAKSIEKNSNSSQQDIPLTPLRLITNQACCKMTIKKKLSDCSVVGSRLVFIMDDLLWVLTDAQLVAALHFLQSLSGLVKKSTQLMQKQKAKRKIEQQQKATTTEKYHQSKSSTRLSPVFNRNDVIETSYHVLCSRIDLHLCDDMDPKDGRSQHPNLKGGGAVQVSLMRLVVDYYPYHRAFASRDHWLRYTEPSSSHNVWVQQLLSLFYDKLQSKGYAPLLPEASLNKAESPKHATVCRISSLSGGSVSYESISCASPASPDDKQTLTRKQSTASSNSETITQDSSGRKNTASRKLSVQQNYRYLMTSCFVVRLEDIITYKVATSSTTRKHAIEKFLVYNKHAHLPSEIKTLHLEHTTYYLPGELEYPVPSPNLFLYLGPLKLYLDTATMLWINAFSLNLQKCLMSMKIDTDSSDVPAPVNIRAEALLPQVVIPSDEKAPTQPDRPKTLQLQASRIILTNCRVGDHASHSHLKECLNVFSSSNIFSDMSQFPWHLDDKKVISDAFLDHVSEEDYDVSPSRSVTPVPKGVISECTNIWSIHLDPFWAEFTICEAGRTRLQSFIDPLPLTLWCYNSNESNTQSRMSVANGICEDTGDEKVFLHGLKSYSSQISNTTCKTFNDKTVNKDKSESDMYLLLHVHSLLNIQLTHFQYLFVLRAVDILSDMMEHIAHDTSTILKDKPVTSVCFVTWCPKIEMSLVLRSLNQMSATSDSVDLTSLQEDCSSNSDIPVASKRGILPSVSSYSIGECCKSAMKQCSSEKYCTGILEDCCMENGVTKSGSDSLLNCHSSSSSHSVTTPVLSGHPDFPTESLQKGLHSGTSAMKRGFCSLVASIDSAFTKTDGHSIDNDISYAEEDTLSLKSDLSCDLDQFVMVNQDGSLEDEFFQHVHPEAPVDVAMEAKEDSISNYTLNSEKKKEMISVAAFKFSQVGFVMQSQLSSCIVIKCNGTETKEEAAISWENFQNMFTARSRGWKLEQSNLPRSDTELSLRITKEATPTPPPTSDNGFLCVLAKNLHVPLLMSSVSGLVDFFEDEVTVKPMPSKIVLSNLCIQLKDDGPPTSLSPNSVPLTISLPGCILERTLDGTLSVLPLPDGYIKDNLNHLLNPAPRKVNSGVFGAFRELNDVHHQCAVDGTHQVACRDNFFGKSLQSSCDIASTEIPSILKLLKENEELKLKVTQIPELQHENQQLREELKKLRRTAYAEGLNTLVAESKIEIENLEDKKRTLQETLNFLQNEVNSLEIKKKIMYTDG